jgi:hypothetical protein
MLVFTDWLSHHLTNPKIVTLHVSRDRSVYDRSTSPGQASSPWRTSQPHGTKFSLRRHPQQRRRRYLIVSVYLMIPASSGTAIPLYSLRLVRIFTLDYLGHGAATALLDGGLPNCTAESRPSAKVIPNVRQADTAAKASEILPLPMYPCLTYKLANLRCRRTRSVPFPQRMSGSGSGGRRGQFDSSGRPALPGFPRAAELTSSVLGLWTLDTRSGVGP